MPPRSVSVFLPSHSIDDFPTWLEESEANALLEAWSAAWHPAVIAAAGSRPTHASVDIPPPSDASVGIVPPFCDDRFAAQASSDDTGLWVRHVEGVEAATLALAAALGISEDVAKDHARAANLPGGKHAETFSALGVATLLAELLACRMRTSADLSSTGFDHAVVAAAEAAVAGDDGAMDERLTEAFSCLDASRARYYPVDSWVIDLVLAAPATTGAMVVDALASPVPAALLASGRTIRTLAARSPDAVSSIRAAIESGRVEACGGRDDERALDLLSLEALEESLQAGRAAWQAALGSMPTCHAAIAGGASAMLPQVLASLGCTSCIWSLFDGTPLPDPGGSRIRWESGGTGIEAIARPPLDASRSSTVLRLADTLGDAIDHDHTAVIQFASYAGTLSRWHRLLRVIASRCTLLGRFVTPSTLVEQSQGTGITASFEPDAFVPSSPPDGGPDEPVNAAAEIVRGECKQMITSLDAIETLVGRRSTTLASTGLTRPMAASAKTGWLARLAGQRPNDDVRALDNGFVRVVAHPRTGGVLSLRRPSDRGNRMSQQLALRTTAPIEGSAWSSPEERGVWTRMEADGIDREGGLAHGALVSRGRLVDAHGKEAGKFRQRMTLVPAMPLAMLDIDITLARPVDGPLYEAHVASRFAWHENEDVEIYRSLHLQAIATERTRFTAPHFIEIVPALARSGPGSGGVAILTGGLPWHVRSSEHVLDCVLAGRGASSVSVRLAVGVGVERPWDAAVAVAAGSVPRGALAVPSNVRLAVSPKGVTGDRLGTIAVSLVESAGRAGDVRIDWGRRIARAVAVDLQGRPLPDVHVAVDGSATVVFLHRYQWLHLILELAHEEAPA